MKPVIALMGPTASGKTAVAMQLVQQLPLEIISVDSTMVYRGLDIGSGKPTADELAAAPHRLIDCCDPADSYSAARFAEDARRHIAEVQAAGNVPLLVGGTFLYFRALTAGLATMPPANEAIRRRLAAEAGEHGWQALHSRLAEVDSRAAARIHSNDAQRIQRALEVFELSGKSLSQWHAEQQLAVKPPLPNLQNLVFLPADRAMLHRNIELRFDAMLSAGLIDEVAALHARGDLSENLPAIRSVGYRQVWQHVAGRCALADARERGIIATRQLAKRQLTWLRNQHADEPRFDASNRSGRERLIAAVTRIVGSG